MREIKEFSHVCEELKSQPVLNYAVIYDNEAKRSECFANAQIDEQVIFLACGNESSKDFNLNAILSGSDNSYCDSIVYFLPKKYINKAKETLNEIVNGWISGEGSEIGYSESGAIYIALRYTPLGMWVLTFDDSTYIAFGKAESLFDTCFKCYPVEEDTIMVDNKCPLVAFNVEESSSEGFFSYFQHNPLFELMQSEGLFDEDCVFYQDE